jgi:acetyl-CoA C-acetyltransferase
VRIRGQAFIAGAFEHPGRELPDASLAQIHGEVARGALADAGLELGDVDGYFCAGDAPGFGPVSIAEYLGLSSRHLEQTELGGASYVAHVGHAAAAIAAGKCTVALITLGGKPRTGGAAPGVTLNDPFAPEAGFEAVYGTSQVGLYALAAQRHMYEFGTTSEQLAAIKVAASKHASRNPNALLPNEVTVEEVIESPLVADPLHRLDCCVMTDGGGALVVVAPEIAATLERTCVKVLGHGEAAVYGASLTSTAAALSGPRAFEEAGITPDDVDYASIYDSFTITVLETVEDLGFCEKGAGGLFVADGALEAPAGRLPFNTDGGGLCNNHPGNRGGMTKVIEAVRQLRGEAHPELQVRDCEIAIAHGTGGAISTRTAATTLVLGREDG